MLKIIPGVEVIKTPLTSTTPPCAKYVKLLLEKLIAALASMDVDIPQIETAPEIENIPEVASVPEIEISSAAENQIKTKCAKCFGQVTEVLNLAKQQIILKRLIMMRKL